MKDRLRLRRFHDGDVHDFHFPTPPGVLTRTMSPTFLPMRALPMGEVTEDPVVRDVGLVGPDELITGLVAVSMSEKETVVPKTTRSPVTPLSSMICEVARQFSISCWRPCRKDWRSFAYWYSAFSEMSPCPRASSMALMFSGISTLLSWSNSFFSFSKPAFVMGIFSIETPPGRFVRQKK
jgi:hypothetical protein